MKIKQPAFAAVYNDEKKPHIMAWTVCGSASLVRQRVGKSWHKDDWETGWREAKIEGVRVVKIDLCATL